MALNMTIPVPRDESLVESFLSPINAINSLNQNMLNQRMQELQNHYYPQQQQSQLDYRNAETNKLNQLTPLQAQALQLKNQFYPDVTKAQINSQNAMANLRNLGGGYGMGVGQKEILGLKNQLNIEHPDWDKNMIDQAASSYLSGENILPNGQQLPPPSGIINTYLAQIHKRNSTAALQNTAGNLQVTAKDFDQIPIDSIAKFAGPGGKIDFAGNLWKMQTDPKSVSEDFRRYKEYQDVISTFAMDTLRKGFGTTVVPGYVNSTLGKAVNPQSDWWNDPIQVARDLKRVKEWIKDNARQYTKLATQGISANIDDNNKSDSINNRIRMINPNGVSGMLRADQVDQAIKAGWKRG